MSDLVEQHETVEEKKEFAIYLLPQIKDFLFGNYCFLDSATKNLITEAFDMAVTALKNYPSAQPELVNNSTILDSEAEAPLTVVNEIANDCISRQAAIDALATWDWQELYLPIHFKQLLEELPPASSDLSEYSDRLWQAAYERGRAEAREEIVHCKDCVYGKPVQDDEEHLVDCAHGIGGADMRTESEDKE